MATATIKITIERDGYQDDRIKTVELEGPDNWLTRVNDIRVGDGLGLRTSR